MNDAVPVIDVADFVAGRAGALEAVARRVRDALTTVGFFVLTGHGVPPALIERTFAEAQRFHALPMNKKVTLKLNRHVNGYMVMGRYAVRTSDLNNNDKGDLNEAFFVKRERAADDPLLLSGRRFVGPNQWPAEADLPGFRAHVLDYCNAMNRFAGRFLPAVARALDLPPHWFDDAFEDSQFTCRLSHYPPVAAEANQFGIAPHTDSNFMTFLPQSEVPGLQMRLPGAGPLGRQMARYALYPGLLRGQFRRHAAPLEQRGVQIDAAPRAAAGRPRALCNPVFPRAALRPADRMPADLHRPRQPAALAADHLCRLAGILVRRQLRSQKPARRGIGRPYLGT